MWNAFKANINCVNFYLIKISHMIEIVALWCTKGSVRSYYHHLDEYKLSEGMLG